MEFACRHFNNCALNLQATEGTAVTFISNIVFVNGGVMNEPLQDLHLRDGATYYYSCGASAESCTDEGRYAVSFHQREDGNYDISFTLNNLTMNDTGQYEVEINTRHANSIFTEENPTRRRVSLTFSLNVTGETVFSGIIREGSIIRGMRGAIAPLTRV